jgi:hypothetical protein
VRAVGIGESLSGGRDEDSVAAALRAILDPVVAERARSFATQLTPQGAMLAARRLVALVKR